MSKFKKLKNWYEENERRVSSFSLLGGFLLDSLTLQRVDSLFENTWLFGNLFVVALCILLINREDNLGDRKDSWKHFWLFNLLQFSLGALLGASFIFYFRSAALAVSWPFLLLLLLAMVGNEVLKKHYDRLVFQLSFLFLSVFIFFIFLLPVLLHNFGVLMFVLSGLSSLVTLWLFIKLLKNFSREKFKKRSSRVWLSILSIYVLINILYFTNLIPPIPLSLKDAGIYHSVAVDSQGRYLVSEEDKEGWKHYLELRQKVHLVPGESLYAYAAIFSPGALNTQVVHEWQNKNEFGEWVTATRIFISLAGGRAQGFRTYSVKSTLSPGKWRINVETPRGQLIGRINFEVISVSSSTPLVTVVKD